MTFVEQALNQITAEPAPPPGRSSSPLSRREQQIARLIAGGRTSKEIAQALGVSDLTVRKHRENLYRKLAISSIVQLVRYCLDQQLIRPAS
ncbi:MULTISPECIES: helix-turn-helix transcriptional regulator [unclassified Pseudomonas]|uniref:response regulator transcription factor n=1 Tax=unclassified Pseudomonas TaxID=196821 RepID=UPI002AC8F7FF|nr:MULTISPECIES: helix-turn-helix transcriptional regulator [unclassified Pseudomonas]MEB0046820.1 helix-turn-helix transcriptional regulator [Pseudomonas sp. Dout3]MEB0099304.1 helix-turn-helix transcriptional regulator [Pseudomonas sp. DC1.2]WPX61222.1 helix-turn-helix transcriptional regulator [Pseudomonas sp. DC1.2]